MNIVCSVDVEEVRSASPGILVLPERTTIAELNTASSRWSDAIVVGAVEEGNYVRGYVLRNGENQIDYLKFSQDSTSEGTFRAPIRQTFEDEDGDVALGVLICRDFQEPSLLNNVMRRLTSSKAKLKIVCIPADMGSEWFVGGPVREFVGAYMALSNNRRTPTYTRRQSFILAPDGTLIEAQIHHEAISFCTP